MAITASAAVASHNQYDHGPWSLDPTPNSFSSQMFVGGGSPQFVLYWFRNDVAHSGGYRMMKCDGTTPISSYTDFAAHEGGQLLFASNVITGTCYRARGYSKFSGASFVTYPTFNG